MSCHANPPELEAGQDILEYAVDLFYRAAEAALDPEAGERDAEGLFALAQAVMASAEAPGRGVPLAAAVSCPTARLRALHSPGWA